MVETRFAEFDGECGGIWPAAIAPVRRRSPRGARIGDKHALLLGYRYEPFSGVFGRELQFVSAGVKDHELSCPARAIQQAQDIVELDAFIPERGSAWLLGIYGDQVIDVGVLLGRAVARVVDESNGPNPQRSDDAPAHVRPRG